MNSVVRVCAGILGLCVAIVAQAQSASAQTILRDAEIEQFLDDYSRPIFRAAGLPADEIKILLIGDQSFNAFAGGLVMGVNTGLLTISDTPNQIEGVIAHEAGHIAGGHSARSDAAISAATKPVLLSLVLAAGAIAAGAPDAGIGILGLGQRIGLANVLKYSRGQESSADQAAISYLTAVHHSGKGLIQSFSKLRNDQLLHSYKIDPYLQSHPLAQARVTALKSRAESSPYFNVTDSPDEIERLRMIQAKIKGFLQDPASTLREFPLSDQSEEAHYARAVAYYRSARIDKGLAEINTLLQAQPQNPYFYELKGQMLFEFGRVEDSIKPHEKSVEFAPDKALLRINLGRALAATETTDNLQRAVMILKSAILLERDNSFAWFELAHAYGALNEVPMADLAMAESNYHNGLKQDAARFARRALNGLKRGTPEWRQATDILVATIDIDPATADKLGPRNSPTQTQPKKQAPQEDRTVPNPPAYQFH
ncbi:MAG: M48 family metalloprotease [Parvularculaceae bacterium]